MNEFIHRRTPPRSSGCGLRWTGPVVWSLRAFGSVLDIAASMMTAHYEACPASNAVTSAARMDGFGAQFASLLSVYSWARRHGLRYCTSTWARMTGARASELFAFVGGPLYGPPALNVTPRLVERHAILASQPPRNANESAWHPSARRFYHVAPKPTLRWFARTPGKHLAVHVRRGDVSHKSMSDRWLSNGLITLCVIHALGTLQREGRAAAAGGESPTSLPRHDASAPWTVHIFSQGKSTSEFGSLQNLPGVQFHLNEPLQDTFNHMVMADGLVMAASTLSDVAAWLMAGRGGRVFAHPQASGLLRYVHRGDLAIERCM